MAAIVDWGKLLGVVVRGLAAGAGVALMFALALRGIVRAGELRSRTRGVWLAHAGLGAVAGAACAGAVVWGIVLLSQK